MLHSLFDKHLVTSGELMIINYSLILCCFLLKFLNKSSKTQNVCQTLSLHSCCINIVWNISWGHPRRSQGATTLLLSFQVGSRTQSHHTTAFYLIIWHVLFHKPPFSLYNFNHSYINQYWFHFPHFLNSKVWPGIFIVSSAFSKPYDTLFIIKNVANCSFKYIYSSC